MSTVRGIFYNTVFLGTAEIVSKILQFVIMIAAARMLSLESFGVFNFAIALSFVAIVLSDLGINTLLIREIARAKNKTATYFCSAFIVKLVLGCFSLVCIYLFLVGFSYNQTAIFVALIIVLFGIVSTFTDLFYSVFRSHEKMGYDASLKIIRMIILSVLSLYVLFNKPDVVLFAAMFLLTEVIVFFIASIIAYKFFLQKLSLPSLSFSIALLRTSLPFGLSLVFGTLYFYIDIIMLSVLKGDVSVGYYSGAYNIVLALLFIPTVFTTALYPVLSRYFVSSRSTVRLLYTRSFKYLLLVGIPITVGLFLLATPIILLFYTNTYSPAIIVLEIIALFVMIKFVNFLLGVVLTSIDQQNKRMICQLSTSIFNIILNLLLIPTLGILGAAIATLITECFLFIVYFYFVSKKLVSFNFLPLLIRPIFACFFMGLFIHFISLHLFLEIIIGGFIYLLTLITIGTFDSQDKKFVGHITDHGNL